MGPSGQNDTIVAIATPRGRGGVGIVKISGPDAASICRAIAGIVPPARRARLAEFRDAAGAALDTGLALYFPEPQSYTGEEVVELQGHGGPVILDILLGRVLELGARLARPGEFSERAFLNSKLDLAQAEAVADLIDSQTREAARGAMRSLSGVFSGQISTLLAELIELRTFIEAAIDFPEEEIDFLGDGQIAAKLEQCVARTDQIQQRAKQGALLRDGLRVVLAGEPNVGKSSLLNALAGEDTAIVTPEPGTTRDLLRETIDLDGLPVHVVDTAGLRRASDVVERIGVDRARQQIEAADRVVLVTEATAESHHDLNVLARAGIGPEAAPPLTVVRNKIDLIGRSAERIAGEDWQEIYVSALTGEGVDLLRAHLKQVAGFAAGTEGVFVARTRHLDALTRAAEALCRGRSHLTDQAAGELLAEELRLAQHALAEITGEYTSDDLLGDIFGSFCIGK